MKLPAALFASVCIICATALSMTDRIAPAACFAVFGFCVWLSDIGSNAKKTTPTP